jgi:hypothetical protein
MAGDYSKSALQVRPAAYYEPLLAAVRSDARGNARDDFLTC